MGFLFPHRLNSTAHAVGIFPSRYSTLFFIEKWTVSIYIIPKAPNVSVTLEVVLVSFSALGRAPPKHNANCHLLSHQV